MRPLSDTIPAAGPGRGLPEARQSKSCNSAWLRTEKAHGCVKPCCLAARFVTGASLLTEKDKALDGINAFAQSDSSRMLEANQDIGLVRGGPARVLEKRVYRGPHLYSMVPM